ETHVAIAATTATTVQSAAQIRCGIASSTRKKTVNRLRRRSSSTTSATGCSCMAALLTERPDRGVTPRIYAPSVTLDRETEERIEQPVSAEAERETRLTPAEAVAEMRINVPARGNRKLRELLDRVNGDKQLKAWWHV